MSRRISAAPERKKHTSLHAAHRKKGQQPETMTQDNRKEQQTVELVERAQAGNRESADLLVEMFYKDIFRMVYCHVNTKMDAEDVTQSVFAHMVKHLASLRNAGSFRPWLYRIAVNKARDFHRKKRWAFFSSVSGERCDTESMFSGRESSEDAVMRKEFWELFHRSTGKMSRREREILIMRFVNQLAIREIAEALGKSESAVKTYLYRAVKKLRTIPEFTNLVHGGSGT